MLTYHSLFGVGGRLDLLELLCSEKTLVFHLGAVRAVGLDVGADKGILRVDVLGVCILHVLQGVCAEHRGILLLAGGSLHQADFS